MKSSPFAVLSATLFFVLFLTGCAQQPPPLNFSVPNVGPTSSKLDAEVRSLTVTLARPDEATGEIEMDSAIIVGPWKEALLEALNRMAIFRDNADKKVSISVKVLKFDAPSFGAEMTTSSAARYEIIDRATGGIIFTQDIEADGVVPADYAFLGLTRGRESINRAVQNNISKFLQALETADLDKPMFPVATNAP